MSTVKAKTHRGATKADDGAITVRTGPEGVEVLVWENDDQAVASTHMELTADAALQMASALLKEAQTLMRREANERGVSNVMQDLGLR